MKEWIAGKNEQDMRLSRFVENVTTGLPPSLLYKSFRNKRIKVNGKKAAPDLRLQEGDLIQLYLNDEFFQSPKPKQERKVSGRRLNVVYEDEGLAVLYKPPHVLCHSDRTGDDSLLDWFQAYLQEKGEYDPGQETTFAPAICNRLDRGTEGLVLAAKNYEVLRAVNELIRTDGIVKEYLTITCGVPPKGMHKAYLRHFEKNNKVQVSDTPREGFKEIITGVQIVRTAGPFALCRIELVTGRTHQIRAHLAHLGAPVLGDIKYGSRKMNEKTGLKTQALCAVCVTFRPLAEGHVLAALSGKKIELKEPDILHLMERLEAQGKQPAKQQAKRTGKGKKEGFHGTL